VIHDISPRALRELFAEPPAFLRLRPFAAVHIQWKPDNKSVRASSRRRTQMRLNRGSQAIKQQFATVGPDRTLDHFNRRYQPRLAIPKREAGPFIAKIDCKVSQAPSR